MQLRQQEEYQHLVMDGIGEVVKARYDRYPSGQECLIIRTESGKELRAPVSTLVNWKIGHSGQKYLGKAERFRQFLKQGTHVTYSTNRDGRVVKVLEWDPVLFNYVWPLIRLIRYGKLIDDTMWQGRDIRQMWKEMKHSKRKGRLEVFIRGGWEPLKGAVL